MKKAIVLILALGLALTVAACGCISPQIQEVQLYLPHTGEDVTDVAFTRLTANTTGTAEHIIELLAAHGALPEGSAMLSFETSRRTAQLDMNAAFSDGLNQMGTTGEILILGSLVNTMLGFFGLNSISITIEGETLETGHEIYDYPLEYFRF
jgi:hypothetical protein